MMVRIVTLLALLLGTANAIAQAPPTPTPMIARDGTEFLRGLLKFHEIEPVTLQQLANLQPGRMILIAIDSGPTTTEGLDLQTLSRVILRNDGAVLIASKKAQDLSGYFPSRTVAQITGETVLQQRNPLVPAIPGEPNEMDRFLMKNLGVVPDPGWGLFSGSKRITANEPSCILIRQRSPFLRNVYASFGEEATLKTTGASVPASRALAIGASGSGESQYRSLVLADSDLLRNRLMVEAQPDGEPLTDNLAFANRLVLWLRGIGETPATSCVFVENNRLITSFDGVTFESPPLEIPPITPDQLPSFTDRNFQKKIAETIDNKLQQWQEEDGPSRSLFGNLRNTAHYQRVLQRLAVVLAMAVLLRILLKFWGSRHEPSLTRLPKDTGQIGGRAPSGSLARRCEELLQTGNHQAVVRDYLRDLFAMAGFPHRAGQQAVDRSLCQLKGKAVKPLDGSLRILWELAYSANPPPVSYSRWKELEPMIESVRVAIVAGTLTMHPQGGSA